MLDIYAGPVAKEKLLNDGFKADFFTHFMGASGGPKWFTLFGLDKYLFGEFFKHRKTTLNLIGSSAGAFRAACLCQSDPVSAITRMAYNYVGTKYSVKPSSQEISEKAMDLLDITMADTGVSQLLNNPIFKAHFLVTRAHGLASKQNYTARSAGMLLGLAKNAINRASLESQFSRCLFSVPTSHLSIRDNSFSTEYYRLNDANLKPALLASGSIPLLMDPVIDIPGCPVGHYMDGGILDYHLDFALKPTTALTLYPHFSDTLKPGWFDKYTTRSMNPAYFSHTVILAPSKQFISALPFAKIPDRKDFTRLPYAERTAYWKTVLDTSEQLAESLDAMINSNVPLKIKSLPF